jgi:CRP/FNR family cyclic AMP-dependent transcriptional regulator
MSSRNWSNERPHVAPRRPESTAIFAYLLDLDDDLAGEFEVRMRFVARQGTTVRVLEAEPGVCDLDGAFAAASGGFGLLVVDGLVVKETRVADRTSAELIGSGDVLQRAERQVEELLERQDRWRVLWPTRMAVLDAEFADRVRQWPQVARTLLRRSSRRTLELDAVRAISGHPRLEVRLDLLFWHLAARWGRVQPDGIRLALPLTHKLLGQLVAAERPSISHALHRLEAAGLVTGSAGDLQLRGSLAQHRRTLTEPTVSHLDHGRPRHLSL